MIHFKELSRLLCLFVVGVVATLGTPEELQAAPAPQDVECTMLLTFCPGSGSLTFECIGDCHPFEGSCVLATLGTFQYCHCVGGGGGGPLYSACTLVYNSANRSIFCANVSCGVCPSPYVDIVDGCYQVYCLC